MITNSQKQNLTMDQKESVALLSMGTFLEYFDVMLYIHMAVVLNELFFPKTDPFIASLLAAFTFCSTYVFRPIGALIFGYIGDTFGRRITVLMTMYIMGGCCVVMAILPTYAEIGITASCVMILCRVIQGMASMGEFIGAELYITETIKPPMQYPMVGLVQLFSVIGGMLALGVGAFVVNFTENWRSAFWIGIGVAVIGIVARTSLRETTDFADAKRELEKFVKQTNRDPKILEASAIWKEKVNKMTAFCLFIIQCAYPLIFYFVYIHCGTIMKDQFGFTAGQVINQNFIVILFELASMSLLTYLSCKIYPLKILKVLLTLTTILFLICPYLLDNINSPSQLLLIQILIIIFALGLFPATPIFYKHLPVFKRFTTSCLMYAGGVAVMFVVTSFGLVYLIHYFGNWGILFIAAPTLVGYKFSLSYFEKLEKESKDGY